MQRLSPSRLNDFLGCRHQAALQLAGVDGDPADPVLELVRNQGFSHEAAVLARLEAQHGPAVSIPDKASFHDRVALTRAAVSRGAALIYQGALVAGPWLGYPDFLVRDDSTPGGAPVYRPEDAKLARRAKGEHLIQLGVYAELLEDMFGFDVGAGVVHVGAGAPQRFDLRRTRFILRRLMTGFERFTADAARVTVPVPCAACAHCDYARRCEAQWRDADSPVFVAGAGAGQAAKLEAAGVTTLTALAALDGDTAIPGMSRAVAERLSAQARLQLQARRTGTPALEHLPMAPGRGFARLPPPDAGDLFFDIEGFPFEDGGREYLLGVYGRFEGAATAEFRPIWGHDRAAEKRAFEAAMRLFTAATARHPGAHIYHYASYETLALKRLAMRHATMEAELDDLLRGKRFVDLHRVVVEALRISTESYSLKAIEVLWGQERASTVTRAMDSVVQYENWRTTGDAAILTAIADYNRADCISTAELQSFLETRRPAAADGAGADGQPLGDDPDLGDGECEHRASPEERAAQRAEQEAKRQDVARRVRACRTGDDALRDLIAELMWFHQRENKPGWWAVFDRQDASDEDLTDDPDCLGGVTPDPAEGPRTVKRSLEISYRFEPQDTRLKPGDTPCLTTTLRSAGTIVELAAEEGHMVLRRGAKAPDLPARFSLGATPVNPKPMPAAVMAFAERFAAGATAADQPLLDILMRRPPRLTGHRAGTPLRAPGEALADAVVRAVTNLEGSYLFIQGPPGTGKTHTAAHAIVALVAAGRRVGVTSNSHRAINNLLRKAESLAAGRVPLAGVKKASAGHGESHYDADSSEIETVSSSTDVGPGHRLVGGTAHHFARDDQRGGYDYLFVDEAGQVSLGNLAAVAGAAANLVLIGDQMQLPQPLAGTHPGETGLSCLQYLLGDRSTVADDRGILLNETWRLHPSLCAFVSAAVYDDRLKPHPSTAARHLVLSAQAAGRVPQAGLAFVPVRHAGCTQSSPEEAAEIADLVTLLLRQRVSDAGTERPLTLADILVVAPYNLQVNLLKHHLPDGAQVGTVDRFQGQEAAVVIVSMTASSAADAPRGTAFLLNENRFNVAVTRARCLAVVVHGDGLLEGAFTGIDDLRRLNLFAHARAVAGAVD